jgi:uncharacterized membrane protein YeaQ/YmgE (transglycosylase-associated protein family)
MVRTAVSTPASSRPATLCSILTPKSDPSSRTNPVRSTSSTKNQNEEYDLGMLLLGIILFGMLIGAAAQLIAGRSATGVDWGRALVAGIIGSFIGGLLISLISGDGLAFRPSGIIGSLAGAIIVTLAWQWWRTRRADPKP